MPVSPVPSETQKTKNNKTKKPTLQDADLGGKEKKVKPEKPKPVDMPTKEMPSGKISDYFPDQWSLLPLSQLEFITDETHPAHQPERLKLPVNKDLAESLKTDGQIRPGHVYPTGDGKYIVLSGMQTTKALRFLEEQGEKNVRLKAFVADPELGDMGGVAVSVIANEFAQQNTQDGKAAVMLQSLKMLGYYNPSTTAEQKTAMKVRVAGFFGVTKVHVQSAINVFEKATADVKQALNEGLIKQTTAAKLASKPKEEQEKAIANARKAAQKSEANRVNADGTASKRAGIITAEKLLSTKPSTALLRELFGQPGVPKDASNLLQYVTGDLDYAGATALLPWMKKAMEKCENAVF